MSLKSLHNKCQKKKQKKTIQWNPYKHRWHNYFFFSINRVVIDHDDDDNDGGGDDVDDDQVSMIYNFIQ